MLLPSPSRLPPAAVLAGVVDSSDNSMSGEFQGIEEVAVVAVFSFDHQRKGKRRRLRFCGPASPVSEATEDLLVITSRLEGDTFESRYENWFSQGIHARVLLPLT